MARIQTACPRGVSVWPPVCAMATRRRLPLRALRVQESEQFRAPLSGARISFHPEGAGLDCLRRRELAAAEPGERLGVSVQHDVGPVGRAMPNVSLPGLSSNLRMVVPNPPLRGLMAASRI